MDPQNTGKLLIFTDCYIYNKSNKTFMNSCYEGSNKDWYRIVINCMSFGELTRQCIFMFTLYLSSVYKSLKTVSRDWYMQVAYSNINHTGVLDADWTVCLLITGNTKGWHPSRWILQCWSLCFSGNQRLPTRGALTSDRFARGQSCSRKVIIIYRWGAPLCFQ